MKGKKFPGVSEKLIETIRNSNGAVIVSHKSPDGDALSSSLALSLILKFLGKETVLLNSGPFTRDEIKKFEPLFLKKCPDDFIRKNPILIIADCSTDDRPGNATEGLEGLRKIVIDHHSSGNIETEEGLSYIVPQSPSTTILVDIVREDLCVPLTKEIASLLYLGFVTDTGFFHFLNRENGAECLNRVASFVDAGVSPYEMYDNLHDGKSLSLIKDTANVILNAKSYYGGKLIICSQTISMEDEVISDDVYDTILQCEGIMVSVLLKEKNGRTEIGFRSKHKSGIDVGKIASDLGGGGHVHASGATLNMTLTEAEEVIVDLFGNL